jgi:hypothetical protein
MCIVPGLHPWIVCHTSMLLCVGRMIQSEYTHGIQLRKVVIPYESCLLITEAPVSAMRFLMLLHFHSYEIPYVIAFPQLWDSLCYCISTAMRFLMLLHFYVTPANKCYVLLPSHLFRLMAVLILYFPPVKSCLTSLWTPLWAEYLATAGQRIPNYCTDRLESSLQAEYRF